LRPGSFGPGLYLHACGHNKLRQSVDILRFSNLGGGKLLVRFSPKKNGKGTRRNENRGSEIKMKKKRRL